jgi:hypothetical protein
MLAHLKDLLRTLSTAFPHGGGRHSLYLDKAGQLRLGVWLGGDFLPVVLDDLPDQTPEALVAYLKAHMHERGYHHPLLQETLNESNVLDGALSPVE